MTETGIMTKYEARQLARRLREARPYILDQPQPHDLIAAQSYLWARDTFVNVATALANEVYTATGGSFATEIFLSNARAVKLPPFKCAECGQHITDGKPCGHGQRDELGIE
jgi:TRAP-type mannitol/chloroaromatic compound transport system substrate-binding protein